MIRPLLGLLMALAIGASCRLFGIPVPAPPALVGAVLVLSMTMGYLTTDRFAGHRPARTAPLCGGPTGLRAPREPGP